MKDLGADGAIILELARQMCEVVDCIHAPVFQKQVRTALFWVVTQRVVVMYSGTGGDGLL